MSAFWWRLRTLHSFLILPGPGALRVAGGSQPQDTGPGQPPWPPFPLHIKKSFPSSFLSLSFLCSLSGPKEEEKQKGGRSALEKHWHQGRRETPIFPNRRPDEKLVLPMLVRTGNRGLPDSSGWAHLTCCPDGNVRCGPKQGVAQSEMFCGDCLAARPSPLVFMVCGSPSVPARLHLVAGQAHGHQAEFSVGGGGLRLGLSCVHPFPSFIC